MAPPGHPLPSSELAHGWAKAAHRGIELAQNPSACRSVPVELGLMRFAGADRVVGVLIMRVRRPLREHADHFVGGHSGHSGHSGHHAGQHGSQRAPGRAGQERPEGRQNVGGTGFFDRRSEA